MVLLKPFLDPDRLIWNSPWLTSVSLVGNPCDLPGHSEVGDPQIHSFLFNQGKCSATTAPHLQYSPQPPCFPHSASTIWKKLSSPSQLPINWPTGTPCIINTLINWMAEILVCIWSPPEASGQLSNWSRRHWVDQKAGFKNTFIWKWDTILSSF